MSKEDFKKLSEEELFEKIMQSEKREVKLKVLGINGIIIGTIGMVLFLVLGITALAAIFGAIIAAGIVLYFVGAHLEGKSKSLVNAQLDDFYEAELEKAFGPRMRTSEMRINEPFLKEIRPVEQRWDECQVWRFYEGNYHGTHFSTANVELYEVVSDPQNGDTRKMKFEGVVLRCKDVCDPALDIALCRPGTDHQSDLMDPPVFRQFFSARTADDQPRTIW